jgi:hypothetical protein
MFTTLPAFPQLHSYSLQPSNIQHQTLDIHQNTCKSKPENFNMAPSAEKNEAMLLCMTAMAMETKTVSCRVTSLTQLGLGIPILTASC